MWPPIEWACEGCGAPVVAFNTARRPLHGLCGICEWLCEHVTDPVEIEQIRRAYGWDQALAHRKPRSMIT
jgi:hypothetical protein